MPLDEKKRWLALQANTLPAPSAWSTSGSNVCRSGLDRQSRLVIPHAPPALTDAQQAKVDQLTEPWQRHLQKLLYALKVEPALYQHQFASALLCAGIRGPWPTQDLATAELFNLFSSPYDAANAEQVAARRAAVAPYLPSAEGLEKGCLLGDVMGLGKTVSAVAGLVLREFVAALSGPDPPSGQTSDQPSHQPSRQPTTPRPPPSPASLSTLVVVPNTLLQTVWRKHLIQAGFHPSQILNYEGDFRATARRDPSKAALRGHRYPRIVLVTKYGLQSEMRGAIEHADAPGLASPLAPTVTSGLSGASKGESMPVKFLISPARALA